MASIYDSVDLDFTFDGDFLIDSTGDIKDTSEDVLLSLRNEIFTIVKSEAGDWKEDLEIGANLRDFIGEANSRENAERIKERIKVALAPIVNTKDLTIRVVPTGIYKVLILLNINVVATQANKLKIGDLIQIAFLYDSTENINHIDLVDLAHFNGRSIGG